LDRVVQRVADGDLNARVDVRGRDEISMLGGALNELVPRLQELLETRASLSAATRVQEALLPREELHGRCIDVAGRSRSSEETGGDFFDVIGGNILGDDRTCLMLADVVGHGLPASLLATTARAYLRGALLSGTSFAEAIQAADVRIFEDSEADRFMVFFAAMHEPAEQRLRVMACGHTGHLLRSGNSEFEVIEPGGIPLGIDPTVACTPRDFDGINPGDLLVVASDGAWEARNPAGMDFGIDRLLELVMTHRDDDLEALLQRLFEEIDAWSGDRDLTDDCTILLARVKG
ncbi:MAG: SpoIIE family protein phosphatase, partial [Phycisphaerales bacterium]|nr:SpoIIE family protein phosphatase [Phycisphaerales bacterium]